MDVGGVVVFVCLWIYASVLWKMDPIKIIIVSFVYFVIKKISQKLIKTYKSFGIFCKFTSRIRKRNVGFLCYVFLCGVSFWLDVFICHHAIRFTSVSFGCVYDVLFCLLSVRKRTSVRSNSTDGAESVIDLLLIAILKTLRAQ